MVQTEQLIQTNTNPHTHTPTKPRSLFRVIFYFGSFSHFSELCVCFIYAFSFLLLLFSLHKYLADTFTPPQLAASGWRKGLWNIHFDSWIYTKWCVQCKLHAYHGRIRWICIETVSIEANYFFSLFDWKIFSCTISFFHA